MSRSYSSPKASSSHFIDFFRLSRACPSFETFSCSENTSRRTSLPDGRVVYVDETDPRSPATMQKRYEGLGYGSLHVA